MVCCLTITVLMVASTYICVNNIIIQRRPGDGTNPKEIQCVLHILLLTTPFRNLAIPVFSV